MSHTPSLTLALTDISGRAETCEPGGTAATLDRAEAEKFAARLRVIADPTRLRLISLVSAQANREACVCDLTEPLGLTQGTVSHHLKILVEAGIFTREQRGTWAYFGLVPGALPALGAEVQAL
ncbi:helix-turn-helix transcriptional regulator [Mycetocola sp. JXN-3]|uniref:ArsR/SmtB family transcription factor n=1 Tax=Mycetocola sp. JXN-3 TaxID=2116510 RepID=UPI001CAA84CF|nr:metalloregulator ArsR/SmtB family transcription factor [Mycetocola sp. JXN-3]